MLTSGTPPTVASMTMRAGLWAGVGALVAVAGLAGCGLPFKTYSDDRTEAATIGEIRVSGGSGDVTVRSGGTETVKVHRTIHYGGNRPGATDHVDGSTLVLDTRCGRNCS